MEVFSRKYTKISKISLFPFFIREKNERRKAFCFESQHRVAATLVSTLVARVGFARFFFLSFFLFVLLRHQKQKISPTSTWRFEKSWQRLSSVRPDSSGTTPLALRQVSARSKQQVCVWGDCYFLFLPFPFFSFDDDDDDVGGGGRRRKVHERVLIE